MNTAWLPTLFPASPQINNRKVGMFFCCYLSLLLTLIFSQCLEGVSFDPVALFVYCFSFVCLLVVYVFIYLFIHLLIYF